MKLLQNCPKIPKILFYKKISFRKITVKTCDQTKPNLKI